MQPEQNPTLLRRQKIQALLRAKRYLTDATARRSLINQESLLWKNWWNSLSFFEKILPLLLNGVYLGAIYVLSHLNLVSASLSVGGETGIRPDHITLGLFVMILWYLGPRVRSFFRFILPLILVAVIYDSMRYYADFLRGPIHVSEPYHFDKTFFGINTAAGRLTPNEWWQIHTHWTLDFIAGFFYLFFITIFVITCMILCFWLPEVGTHKRSPEWIRAQAFRPMWAFFWVNMIGYSTYYWYAAAPPWYVAAHGLGPADMTVAASAAGALRFDALLGTHFFTGMYGKAADVFGAIPSLHVSYPLIAVYYAQRYGALRTFTAFFYFIMCFSAVYLNHHYLLDILWGSSYAIIVCFGLDFIANRKKERVHS
jgi:hypothetical protein